MQQIIIGVVVIIVVVAVVVIAGCWQGVTPEAYTNYTAPTATVNTVQNCYLLNNHYKMYSKPGSTITDDLTLCQSGNTKLSPKPQGELELSSSATKKTVFQVNDGGEKRIILNGDGSSSQTMGLWTANMKIDDASGNGGHLKPDTILAKGLKVKNGNKHIIISSQKVEIKDEADDRPTTMTVSDYKKVKQYAQNLGMIKPEKTITFGDADDADDEDDDFTANANVNLLASPVMFDGSADPVYWAIDSDDNDNHSLYMMTPPDSEGTQTRKTVTLSEEEHDALNKTYARNMPAIQSMIRKFWNSVSDNDNVPPDTTWTLSPDTSTTKTTDGHMVTFKDITVQNRPSLPNVHVNDQTVASDVVAENIKLGEKKSENKQPWNIMLGLERENDFFSAIMPPSLSTSFNALSFTSHDDSSSRYTLGDDDNVIQMPNSTNVTSDNLKILKGLQEFLLTSEPTPFIKKQTQNKNQDIEFGRVLADIYDPSRDATIKLGIKNDTYKEANFRAQKLRMFNGGTLVAFNKPLVIVPAPGGIPQDMRLTRSLSKCSTDVSFTKSIQMQIPPHNGYPDMYWKVKPTQTTTQPYLQLNVEIELIPSTGEDEDEALCVDNKTTPKFCGMSNAPNMTKMSLYAQGIDAYSSDDKRYVTDKLAVHLVYKSPNSKNFYLKNIDTSNNPCVKLTSDVNKATSWLMIGQLNNMPY